MISIVFRKAVLLGILVGPVAVALYLAAAEASRDRGDRNLARDAIFWCFAFYVALVGLLTLAPPPLSRSNGLFGTNLIPVLYSIRCFVPNPGQPSTTLFCSKIILGNFAIFVPLGVLLPLISVRLASARRVFLVALGASVSIEVLQYVGRRFGSPRWSDIDDVLLNVTGALFGYVVCRLMLARPADFDART